MAGGTERTLRRRISSVQSTKKITRAMELIATTRVVKAQQRANASRPYAEKITDVIEDLASQNSDISHPLFRSVESKNLGIVMITSDRGLAGPYNSQIIRMAERELMAGQSQGKGYELISLGKKGKSYFSFRNYRIAKAYEGMSDAPTYENAVEVAKTVVDLFLEEKVDEVRLIYTEFESLSRQNVVVRRFLPLASPEEIVAEKVGENVSRASFEFEPSPEGILKSLLPRYVESRLYSAMLDAAASEHANRQRAMKAATDNAEELIVKLVRQMNRARQDAITTEIMEIVGGAEALKESHGGSEDYEEEVSYT